MVRIRPYPSFRYLHAYIMTPVARWIGFMQSEDTLQDVSDSNNYGDDRGMVYGIAIPTLFQDRVPDLSDMGAFQHALPGGWSKDTNPYLYTSFRAGWAFFELSCTFFYPYPRSSSLRCAIRIHKRDQESNVSPILARLRRHQAATTQHCHLLW